MKTRWTFSGVGRGWAGVEWRVLAGSFSDAEGGEDAAQDVVWGDVADEFAELVEGGAEGVGDEFWSREGLCGGVDGVVGFVQVGLGAGEGEAVAREESGEVACGGGAGGVGEGAAEGWEVPAVEGADGDGGRDVSGATPILRTSRLTCVACSTIVCLGREVQAIGECSDADHGAGREKIACEAHRGEVQIRLEAAVGIAPEERVGAEKRVASGDLCEEVGRRRRE